MERVVVGAVFPDDAWVYRDVTALVDDFASYAPPSVQLEASGTPCPNWDADVESGVWLATNGDIEESARRLMGLKPAAIGYFCTTVSFVRGLGGEADIARRITDATGVPATTTSGALLEALRALGSRRVAIASPYMADVDASLQAYLRSAGYDPVASVALHFTAGHSTTPVNVIVEAALRADTDAADVLFISCTGQRVAGELKGLEARLGKPVIAANQVTMWHLLHLAGAATDVPDRGSLFDIAPTASRAAVG
jgi:maleate isomerase